MIGTIKKGSNTKNHSVALTRLGYSVTDRGEHIEVEGSEVVTHLDLTSNPAAVLRQITQEKKLLTYGSKITYITPDGEVKDATSVPMCLALGSICKRLGVPLNLSCLVVKVDSKKKETAPTAAAEGWEDFV